MACTKARFLTLAIAAICSIGAMANGPGHRHHQLAQDVDAFHALLAPVWHARPGPERQQDACAKAGELSRLASAIRSANAALLTASVSSLADACNNNPSGVDGALHDVHEAFHELMEAKPVRSRR